MISCHLIPLQVNGVYFHKATPVVLDLHLNRPAITESDKPAVTVAQGCSRKMHFKAYVVWPDDYFGQVYVQVGTLYYSQCILPS